jgi:hypothetical protein
VVIQIPTTVVSTNTTVDFHRNDLISPPAAPSIVESLTAIDPRVALKMPLPVVNSAAGHALHDALQEAAAKFGAANLQQLEPHVDKAVLLELSNAVGSNVLIGGEDQSADITNLISQNLTRLDKTGSAALGQLLSDILQVDVPGLGEQVATQNKLKASSDAVVAWPNLGMVKTEGQVDPKIAMNILYQNLQNSGIFAADQLKKLLLPADSSGDEKALDPSSFQDEAEKLLSQLSTNSPTVPDSVKLLLRGDLLWQGQLLPNVQGRIYREDAWETDANPPFELHKGSRISLEVTLPNLGPFKVVGTQFDENIKLAIEAVSPEAKAVLANSFPELIEQVQNRIDPQTTVSLQDESKAP